MTARILDFGARVPVPDLVRMHRQIAAAKLFVELCDLRQAKGWHKIPTADLDRLRALLEDE